MKNPASDVSRLPSSRKRGNEHKTPPSPSRVDVIWNELCSWMVSQTLRKTSKTTQETGFRLVPALLEQFWDQDFPCPAPFLQALTVRLLQHGPFQRWRKEDPEVRGRLFSALLRLDAGRGLVLPFVEACLPRENHPEVLARLIESWPPGLVCPETIWQQWCEKTRLPVNADNGDQRKLRQLAWKALFQLDAGRGLVLPFVETCLPHENRPEVLAALIESWPPGLVCPETIWQQWCEKTRPPVNSGEDDGAREELRQLAWQALFQLPAPERAPTGSPRWLSFLRQQLKLETSPQVLESIWSGLNQLGRWPTSAEERTAWLAELERHAPCGSKASDRFVTRDSVLREAIIWRVLFGMQVPASETDASVLSGELLLRYLSDYLNCLNLPVLLSPLPYQDALLRLLETMTMLPATEHDRRAWLDTWEETGAMTGGSSVSREAFWEVMVRAQKVGLYPAEETMEAAIRDLGSEIDFPVFRTAADWVPPAGRLQKLWSDFWEPYLSSWEPHVFSRFAYTAWAAWKAWRPAGDGYETFCSRLTEIPNEFRRTAARYLLEWHRTEMTQERWHAWWAQWVRQESELWTLEQLSYAMQDWQPLPEVILSAWRERGQGGEPYPGVRCLAWRVLVSQPVDLSQDIIRHLPGETDPKVLETMAGWSPAATPVPADFWKEWGKKFTTLSFSSDEDAFLLYPLVTCCLKWRPATPEQIQEMWTMWEQIFTHCPTNRVRDILKLLSSAPFLAPPDSPGLSNLVTNKWTGWTEESSSFTGNISNPLWWEQPAENMISHIIKYDYWISYAINYNYWRTTAYPEEQDYLKSFQWICEHSLARGRGLLPGWNTLRPVLEKPSTSPEVELFFFSLVRKWGSPEGWQAWWGLDAAMESRDDFVTSGGCSGMIRRVYLVETLAASLSSCGEQADETTLRRLFRQLKQQWWRAEDVRLWQWLGELVEKAVAAGEGRGFRRTGSAVLLDRMLPLSSELPAWEFRPTSGQVSGFHPARPASFSLT